MFWMRMMFRKILFLGFFAYLICQKSLAVGPGCSVTNKVALDSAGGKLSIKTIEYMDDFSIVDKGNKNVCKDYSELIINNGLCEICNRGVKGSEDINYFTWVDMASSDTEALLIDGVLLKPYKNIKSEEKREEARRATLNRVVNNHKNNLAIYQWSSIDIDNDGVSERVVRWRGPSRKSCLTSYSNKASHYYGILSDTTLQKYASNRYEKYLLGSLTPFSYGERTYIEMWSPSPDHKSGVLYLYKPVVAKSGADRLGISQVQICKITIGTDN